MGEKIILLVKTFCCNKDTVPDISREKQIAFMPSMGEYRLELIIIDHFLCEIDISYYIFFWIISCQIHNKFILLKLSSSSEARGARLRESTVALVLIIHANAVIEKNVGPRNDYSLVFLVCLSYSSMISPKWDPRRRSRIHR